METDQDEPREIDEAQIVSYGPDVEGEPFTAEDDQPIDLVPVDPERVRDIEPLTEDGLLKKISDVEVGQTILLCDQSITAEVTEIARLKMLLRIVQIGAIPGTPEQLLHPRQYREQIQRRRKRIAELVKLRLEVEELQAPIADPSSLEIPEVVPPPDLNGGRHA